MKFPVLVPLLLTWFTCFLVFGCSSGGGEKKASVDPNAKPLIIGNGGGTVTGGEHVNLSWDEELSPHDVVAVEVSRDGGQTWEFVELAVPNNGSYSYSVPNVPGLIFRLRIVDQDELVLAESQDVEVVAGATSTPTPSPTPVPVDPILFDSVGGFFKSYEGFHNNPGEGVWAWMDGHTARPTDVKVDELGGKVLLLEYDRISKYDLNTGAYEGAIGYSVANYGNCSSQDNTSSWCKGSVFWATTEEGGFNTPAGMALDTVGRKIYVAGYYDNRIQRFDLDSGAYEGSVGVHGGGYVTTTTSYDNPQPFSVSGWFKTTSNDGGSIIGFHSLQTGWANAYGRNIYFQPDGKLRFGIWTGSVQSVVSASSYNDGNWHHVVGTFQANEMKLYIDGGAEVLTLTAGVPSAQNYTGYWRIGQNRQTNWTGAGRNSGTAMSLDNIGIWNTVLSAGDATTLYNNPQLGPGSPQWGNAVAAWNFEETTGETFADETGNGNTGNLQGDTTVGTTGVGGGKALTFNYQKTNGWTTGKIMRGTRAEGGFYIPMDVEVDVANDVMYVSDQQNHRLKKFRLSTGQYIGSIGRTSSTYGDCPASGPTTTWCTGGHFISGNGDGMLSHTSRMALDTANDILYVTDSGNNRASKFVASTGVYVGSIGKVNSSTGTCPASGAAPGWCSGGAFGSGAGDGQFNNIADINIDVAGDLGFIVDYSNRRVTKFTLSTGAHVGSIGKVKTTGGTCSTTGVTNGWCAGGTFEGTDELGGFDLPRAMTVSGGKLWVADRENWRVQIFNAATGLLENVLGGTWVDPSPTWQKTEVGKQVNSSGKPGAFNWPTAIEAIPNQDLFLVADGNNSRVAKYRMSSGELLGYIGKFSASTGDCPVGVASGWCTGGTGESANEDGAFETPRGVAVDVAGDAFYVTDSSNGRVSRFTLSTGAFVGSVGNSTASTGSCPAGAAAPNWCTGGTFGSGSADGMYFNPAIIDFDPTSGHLYIADRENHRVAKLLASTGAFVGGLGQVNATTGTCPATGATNGFCTGGTFELGLGDGGFYDPVGVNLDATTNVLLVTDRSGKVSKLNLATGEFQGAIGEVDTKPDTGDCPDSGVAPGWCTGANFKTSSEDGGIANKSGGVHIDTANNVFYLPDYSNRINRFQLDTGEFLGALGYATESTGTCIAHNAQIEWCTGGTFGLTYADGGFYDPTDITMDNDGNLYVVDGGVHRIVRVLPPEEE